MKKEEHTGNIFEIGDEKAECKVGQALRDGLVDCSGRSIYNYSSKTVSVAAKRCEIKSARSKMLQHNAKESRYDRERAFVDKFITQRNTQFNTPHERRHKSRPPFLTDNLKPKSKSRKSFRVFQHDISYLDFPPRSSSLFAAPKSIQIAPPPLKDPQDRLHTPRFSSREFSNVKNRLFTPFKEEPLEFESPTRQRFEQLNPTFQNFTTPSPRTIYRKRQNSRLRCSPITSGSQRRRSESYGLDSSTHLDGNRDILNNLLNVPRCDI